MINKIVLIFACFAIFQSLLFAWSECKAGFYLDVPIQVIDNNSINAPGVNVSLTYQKRDEYFFPGQPEYVTTDAVLTDSNGMATFKIKNDVPNSNYLDCKLVFHVNYLNFTKNYTFNLGTFYGKYIINIPGKRVLVSMVDSSGSPISGTLTLYPSMEFQLNNTLSIFLPYGSTPGYMIFNGHRQGLSLNVDSSTPNFINAVFRSYDVNVSVLDDLGKPINFIVQVGTNDPINATDAVRLRLIDNPASIKITSSGRETFRQINPEKETNITIFYDIHAPEISSVNIVPEQDGKVSVTYTVSDNGIRPSGIRETGIYVDNVYYSSSLKYSSAKATVSKAGSFSFQIVATDNDGNKAEVSADYVSGKPPVITENTSGNDTDANPPATQKGDDWTMLGLIVVIVLVLLVVVYFYIRNNYISN